MKEKSYNKKQLEIITLFLDDFRKALHLREISRRIGSDTKTTSLHLQELEKIRVLTSSRVGRHKQFTLNFKSVLTRYYLIAGEMYRTINLLSRKFRLRKVCEMLTSDTREDALLLVFGSYSKGTEDESSDLDVLVVNDDIKDELLEEIKLEYGIEVSVVSLTRKKFYTLQRRREPFIREIMDSHIILKGFSFFIESVWRNYYGFKTRMV
ncbi:MAG: nucleotidyltransferase domain-containing protein [Candidatus Aenigmarchaeota archaeon]|nr:nucleotidyltransferase domain-containing protein [Candidatus Aenigmarchaeota archaeon]